jgi:hypothetical protein
MRKRPVILTIFCILLILLGAVGFVGHFPAHRPPYHADDFLPDLLELVLIAAAVFLLRGRNWARWLALAWITFHLAVSFYNSMGKVIAHTVILVIFVAILFNPPVNAWFRGQSRPT